MAKVTLEQLTEQINTACGEGSDTALSLIENIHDSFAPTDGEDWKQKYEDNDKMWRERYSARFMGKKPEDEEQFLSPQQNERKVKTFEQLFKEV